MTECDIDYRNRRASPFRDIDPSAYDAALKSMGAPKELLAQDPVLYGLDEWQGDIRARRFNVTVDDLTFECFGTLATRKKLFVFLSAARSRRSTTFHRVGWHPWFDGVCLNIEDPTYRNFDLLTCPGFYIGSRETHALPLTVEIVKKVQRQYEIPNSEVHFIGTSSGGFAALWMADAIPGAVALAGNPQFYGTHWPAATRYREIGIDLASPQFYARTNLDHIKTDGSKYLVVVNAKSSDDFHVQLPLFLKTRNLPKISYGLNKFDNLYLYCKNSDNRGTINPHHAFTDARQARALLDIFSENVSFETMSSIMNMVHEMEYARQSLADKLFFMETWEWFITDWDLPLSLPRTPVQGNVAAFPIQGFDDLSFHVLMSPKAKGFSISLKSSNCARLQLFEQMAMQGLGEIKQADGKLTLHLGEFPRPAARTALGTAVANVRARIPADPVAHNSRRFGRAIRQLGRLVGAFGPQPQS